MPSTARVLVVDDDAMDRERLGRLAARIPLVGHVVGVATGDEAVAELAKGTCDVVLLDLLLGGEDGLDLLPRIRPVPCVLLTGMQDPAVIVTAMRAGAIDYVSKEGLGIERLEQALRNALRVAEAEREIAAARAALERQVSVLGSLVELARRVLATRDADEALLTGLRAGSLLFGARVALAFTREQRRFASSYSPFGDDVVAPLAQRMVTPIADVEGVQVGEMCCDRAAPPFDRADELAAMQLCRAIVGAMEKHELIEESQSRQREREEIVAVVSHDLRTPLQTFSFGLDALRRPSSPEKHEEVVVRMTRSAQRMTRLIDDLLDVSRIHDGKLSLRIERVDAPRLLAHVAEQLASQAAAHDVTLVVETTEPLSLLADEARLEQALANIVTNAVRIAPGGRVTLRATTVEASALFEVIDEGPGVPPAVRRQLFERLYQGAEGERGALGLGLYIVRGIAEAHGGSVGVTDAPGRGSCFWIRVPLTPALPAPSSA